MAEARRLGAPRRMIALMLFHVLLDWLIGLTALVSDIFDIAYKANRRNIELLKRYLERA